MILFTILTITVILLLIFTVFALSVGGAVMIVIFGDVIVCIGFIVMIMKFIANRR